MLNALKPLIKKPNTKIVCQTYGVGKERMFEAIAKEFGIKFWPTAKSRLETLKIIY